MGIGTNKPQSLLHVAGEVTASAFNGSGAGLTNLNAGSLSSGTLPGSRLSGTYGNVLTLNNPANSFNGTFSGNGAGLTSLNASELAGGTVPDARLSANVARTNQVWLLSGNAGTTPGTHFLGTTDNKPLEFKVDRLRALRLENNGDGSDSDTRPDGAPNVIGGSPGNYAGAGVVGATIAGGGATNYAGSSRPQAVLADYGTVGGGLGNRIEAGSASAVIAGGLENTIRSNASFSAISGGYWNSIGTDADYTAIGGGYWNAIEADADYATVGGGYGNTIKSNAIRSTIGGGYLNLIATDARSATICGGDENMIQTNAFSATIGGGCENNIQPSASYATIGGGYQNMIQTNATWSTIGGGYGNTIQANALYATIPGGRYNSATNYAFAAGRRAKAYHTGAFVWADSTDADFASTAPNQFLIRASGGVGIGGPPTSALLDVKGDMRVNDFDLRLRPGTDTYQGLGWYGSGKTFAGLAPDGPVLYGWAGGVLGTFRGGQRAVLRWDDSKVGIGRTPTVNTLEVEGNASKTTAGSWLANSDSRIKTDITTVTNALETLAKVRLVSFRYTDAYRAAHPGVEDRRYVNVVAQEFAEVFPDEVKSSGEKLADGAEILQVDIHPLIIYSAAAVQELNAKLREKEGRIAELETRVAQLTALVQSLAAKVNGGGQ